MHKTETLPLPLPPPASSPGSQEISVGMFHGTRHQNTVEDG